MQPETRRTLKGVLVFIGLAFAGCAGLSPAGAPTGPLLLEDRPRRPGYPAVLLAMPKGDAFRDAARALSTELAKKFDIVPFVVGPGATSKTLLARVREAAPSCLVLMDNSAVTLWRGAQKQAGAGSPLPPAVVLMAAFLQQIKADLANTEGIAYEIPGVTAFVQLRAIVTRPVNRVGVIYRPGLAKFIEQERMLAAKEQISLVSLQVQRDPSSSEIAAALTMLKERGIDALWILNDNGLIKNNEFFRAAWLEPAPRLDVPIVVNVRTLIDPRLQFGTLGVLPDHEALGAQAANMVLDLSDAGWIIHQPTVELPTSTITIVDMTQLRGRFQMRKDAEQRIDKALE